MATAVIPDWARHIESLADPEHNSRTIGTAELVTASGSVVKDVGPEELIKGGWLGNECTRNALSTVGPCTVCLGLLPAEIGLTGQLSTVSVGSVRTALPSPAFSRDPQERHDWNE